MEINRLHIAVSEAIESACCAVVEADVEYRHYADAAMSVLLAACLHIAKSTHCWRLLKQLLEKSLETVAEEMAKTEDSHGKTDA